MASQPKQPERSQAQIQREIDESQRNLENHIAELIDEVHPKAVIHRSVDEAKTFATDQFESVRDQVKDEYGWRVDRLVVIGGAVLGAVTFALVVRGLVRRSRGY